MFERERIVFFLSSDEDNISSIILNWLHHTINSDLLIRREKTEAFADLIELFQSVIRD